MSDAEPPLVRANGVSKRYAGEPVLRDVSFSIRAGEFVAITGPSGSGKSTLLHLMGMLDDEYQGSLELWGQDLKRLDDRARSRLRAGSIGFVFQAFHLLEHLSCRENVLLPGYFHDGQPEGQDRAREVLERVGLAGKEHESPARLSGGQKQRLAIARALCNRPRLMLCDEPTGNLDQRTGAQILELFQTLHRDDGITFVVVTHEDRVSQVAGRVLRLEDGALKS